MTLDKKFYINTGKDGVLEDTKEHHVDALIDAMGQSEKAVVHFHGGLVNKNKALAKATELVPVYQAAGAHPVFFVWESGFTEIVRHNLDEIRKEKIFKILLAKVLKHAVGKFFDTGGAKSITGVVQLPTDIEVAVQLQKLEAGAEPYADLSAPGDLEDVTEAQEKRLVEELTADSGFAEEVEAIVAEVHPSTVEANAKGITTGERNSKKSLMSPEVVDELVADRQQAQVAGAKGVLSTAKLALRVGKVLFRVIRRMRKGRGHGLHCTVVEEILRDLYIANIGASVWHAMKKETADAFADVPGSLRGGRLFVAKLGRLAEQGKLPEISLVGHSTGAVSICHLLSHVAEARQDPNHPLPADFTFENVIFLAPAVSCLLFAETLDPHAGLIDNFRMFSMNDDKEADDNLFFQIYPRSLLYFVSGVVEREENGEGAYDLPLVGMERYFTDTENYTMPEVTAIRAYFEADADRTVWSVDDRGDGLAANSLAHGDFDEIGKDEGGTERTTMKSVQHMIGHGA